MLECVQLQRLGGAEARIGRESQGPPQHGFATDAHQDRSLIGLESVQLPHTGIVRLCAIDESETGIENEVDILHFRHAFRQVELAAESPYIRSTVLAHEVVHRFASARDVVDNHGTELLQGFLCYSRTKSIQGEGHLRQGFSDRTQSRFYPLPFFLLTCRRTARAGGTSADIQDIRSVGYRFFRPSEDTVLLLLRRRTYP